MPDKPIRDAPQPSRMRALKSVVGAIVKVGAGRGFVVANTIGQHFIITAAHCLPRYPEPHLGRYLEEETYANLIGLLNGEQNIWATLLSVDPMSDIAVFGEPNGQALSDEYDHYEAFMAAIDPISIGEPPASKQTAFMLSLDGEWQRCCIEQRISGFVIVVEGGDNIKSGSPIVNRNGDAVGVISTSGGGRSNMNPSVIGCLPQRLLTQFQADD